MLSNNWRKLWTILAISKDDNKKVFSNWYFNDGQKYLFHTVFKSCVWHKNYRTSRVLVGQSGVYQWISSLFVLRSRFVGHECRHSRVSLLLWEHRLNHCFGCGGLYFRLIYCTQIHWNRLHWAILQCSTF